MAKRRNSGSVTQRADGASGSRPIVAIVGRPNVGKSALFNRLTGAPMAIVEDMPGVTRDRMYAEALALGHPYVLIDTGGFDPGSDDPLTLNIATHVKLALEEADVVICVLDATVSPLPSDREAVQLLRQSTLPVLFVANKADNPELAHRGLDLYSLGIDRLRPISALHGHGIFLRPMRTRSSSTFASIASRSWAARTPARARSSIACSESSGRSSMIVPAPPSTASTRCCKSAMSR
jgi:GTP-binding protein